jgi:hypothetical protein
MCQLHMKWVVCGNLCKHQIAIILAYTYVIVKIILDYCGTWYGIDWRGFKAKFTNLHLLDNNSNASYDDEKSNWIINGEGVVDIGGLIFLGDDISRFDDVRVLQAQVSDAPIE